MTKVATTPRPKITYGGVLGKVIAHRRGQLQLTQEPFARDLGITRSGYSRIEKGLTAVSVQQLQPIAHLLHCKPSDLVSDADRYAQLLRARGAELVADRKGVAPAALVIAAGILLALLASSS